MVATKEVALQLQSCRFEPPSIQILLSAPTARRTDCARAAPAIVTAAAIASFVRLRVLIVSPSLGAGLRDVPSRAARLVEETVPLAGAPRRQANCRTFVRQWLS